jgi:hypothetical protein
MGARPGITQLYSRNLENSNESPVDLENENHVRPSREFWSTLAAQRLVNAVIGKVKY